MSMEMSYRRWALALLLVTASYLIVVFHGVSQAVSLVPAVNPNSLIGEPPRVTWTWNRSSSGT
jgi:hypothetical protein